MSKALRLSEKWFRFGLWIVAFVFASFLIGLGGTIVANLPKVEHRYALDDFIDKPASEQLRNQLRTLQEKGGFVQFETLFDPAMGPPGLVVHFIAMLELGREKLIRITQTEAFAPIYINLGSNEAEAVMEEGDGAEPSQAGA